MSDSQRTVRLFQGCSCQLTLDEPAALAVRWTIGLASTPFFHTLDVRTFLSLRLTLQSYGVIDGGQFSRIVDTIFSIGVVVPVVNETSSLVALNRVRTPTVSAVNGQWKQLLATLQGVPVTSAMCLQFRSATIDEVEHYLMSPKFSSPTFHCDKHIHCSRCIAESCSIAASSGATLLSHYGASFFTPLTAILEMAVIRGWGVYSDFLDKTSCPLGPSKNAKPIPLDA
jgi:hypothetical protein